MHVQENSISTEVLLGLTLFIYLFLHFKSFSPLITPFKIIPTMSSLWEKTI